MKQTAIVIAAISVVSSALCVPAHTGEPGGLSDITCTIGPMSVMLVEQHWNLFSCADEETLLVIPSNPDAVGHFYFSVTLEQDGVHVVQEGSGETEIASDAQAELEEITPSDVIALIHRTKMFHLR